MVSNQDTTFTVAITTPWNPHHIPIWVLYRVRINGQPCSSAWRRQYWLLSSPYFLFLAGGEVAVMVLGKLRSRGESASDKPISSQDSRVSGPHLETHWIHPLVRVRGRVQVLIGC